MKTFYYIFFAILLLVFTGCDKTEVIEVDLNYQEYTVIRSEVKSGEVFQGVTVTKTIPVGIEYSIERAEIKDAYLYIRVNGVQIIPLHYSGKGLYKTKYDVNISAGNKYELFGNANGRAFYSITKAPHKPVTISANFNSNQFIEARVSPYSDEVFGAVWLAGNKQAEDFYSIESPRTENPSAQILLRTQTLPEEYQGNKYVQVFSFDKDFQAYFQTKGQNRPVEDAFAQGGTEITWNVVGENVIGMFIGVAEGDIYAVR